MMSSDWVSEQTEVSSRRARSRPGRVAVAAALVVVGVLASASALASAEPAGKVRGLRGSATARATDGGVRKLSRGDKVFSGERIATGRRSFVLLLFADKTKFALGQRSTMEVSNFVYNQPGRRDNIATRVLKGAFRFVSGLIAKRRPGLMSVRLGIIATIGLRGTNVAGEVVGDSAKVVLLDPENPDQATGIDVSNDFGAVSIDEPGYGTEIPDAHSPPSPPRRMRLRAVENLMRSLQSISRISVPRPRMH